MTSPESQPEELPQVDVPEPPRTGYRTWQYARHPDYDFKKDRYYTLQDLKPVTEQIDKLKDEVANTGDPRAKALLQALEAQKAAELRKVAVRAGNTGPIPKQEFKSSLKMKAVGSDEYNDYEPQEDDDEEMAPTPYKNTRLEHLLMTGFGHVADEGKRKRMTAALRLIDNHQQKGMTQILNNARRVIRGGAGYDAFESLISPRQIEWLKQQGTDPKDILMVAKELYCMENPINSTKRKDDPHMSATERAFKSGDLTMDDPIAKEHFDVYPHMAEMYGKQAEVKNKDNEANRKKKPEPVPDAVDPVERDDYEDDKDLSSAELKLLEKVMKLTSA